MLYFILASFFVTFHCSAGEWWSIPRSEDDQYLYYVGISEGKDGVSQLQDKAFNKAMGELIREHFGMSIQINENSVEELRKEQFQVVTKQSSAPLFIKGVGIVKTYEKELDDANRIYVQIRVDKKILAQAITNQITKPGEDSLNTFGDSHDSKIDIKVKTSPQGALIHFGHLDRRFSLQGQGDARFFLPRGRYQMVVSSPGFATVSKEINHQSEGREENIILDELSGEIDLEVYPEDATIVYQKTKIPAGKQKLQLERSHKFYFSHPDYFPQELEFVLDNPETITKVIKLEPRPSTIRLDVHPRNSSIFVDDKEVHGKVIELEPGRRTITVRANGYFSHTEEIYVGTNREYPLKVIRLRYDDQNMSPTDKRISLRFEMNPFTSYDKVGYGMIGLGAHIEFHYISIGGGFNYTSYKKDTDEGMPEDEFNMSDTYGMVRLITPKMGVFKLFASGTYGEYSKNRKTSLGDTLWKETKSYQGVGGGFRAYITPKWSFHGEYFKIKALDTETKIKSKQDRFIMGFGYEF